MLMSHEGDWENIFLLLSSLYMEKNCGACGQDSGHTAANQRDHNYWIIA